MDRVGWNAISQNTDATSIGFECHLEVIPIRGGIYGCQCLYFEEHNVSE